MPKQSVETPQDAFTLDALGVLFPWPPRSLVFRGITDSPAQPMEQRVGAVAEKPPLPAPRELINGARESGARRGVGPHAWLGQAEPAGAADGARGGGERIKILVSSRWVRMIQWIRLGAAPGCGALLN